MSCETLGSDASHCKKRGVSLYKRNKDQLCNKSVNLQLRSSIANHEETDYPTIWNFNLISNFYSEISMCDPKALESVVQAFYDTNQDGTYNEPTFQQGNTNWRIRWHLIITILVLQDHQLSEKDIMILVDNAFGIIRAKATHQDEKNHVIL